MVKEQARGVGWWAARVLAWGWWAVTSFFVSAGVTDSAPAEPISSLTDAVLGLVILILLRWRHRRPLVIAVVTFALSTLSLSGMPAALWAFASLSTSRDWRRIIPLPVLAFIVGFLTYRPDRGDPALVGFGDGVERLMPVIAGAMAMLTYLAAMGLGVYIGARRELVRSLRERAELAEERRHLEIVSAQEAERNRIAREMHDVVAHRLSLVSMQAAALSFRDDLDPEEGKELAEQIQANSRQALDELRSVLGSLRNVDDAGAVAKPQPTLAQLPALLADAREAGQHIDATLAVDAEAVPQQLSRHAFRVVQEGLTNARKHAAGTRVRLTVDEHDGDLRIVITNPLRVGGAALPGAGQGLIGVGERVQLAGGRFEAGAVGDEFHLKAWMPWRSAS